MELLHVSGQLMVANPTTSATDPSSDTIRFVLDGEIIELDDVDPTRTVLEFLREDLRRTGTKEGCAEGDCGACTVVLVELGSDGNSPALRAVNSCIQFLPTLDGKELITVESLCRNGTLHPVQRALIDNHGSQCGFCTPGFVMSLYALYETNPQPTRRDIDDALAGNLCRCTGYRPIIEAARAMYRLPQEPEAYFHADLLRAVNRSDDLFVRHGNRLFFAPTNSDSLAAILTQYPDSTLLAGGTDVGLWVTKQHRQLETVVYTGRVAELNSIHLSPTHLELGGAVTLTDSMPSIFAHYPDLEELFKRFASPPIRNAGTLGGNIANGSPIGDSMPALMVAGTTLVLRRGERIREVALADFYVDYRINDLRAGEFIQTIRIPRPEDGVILRSHKLSKRFDQDISAVCGAYRLQLDGETVRSFRMACGGLATTIRRATNCEAAVAGKPWNDATIAAASAALAKDYQPISDMRASAGYRLKAAQNLLRRFYLETRGELPVTVYGYGRES